MPETHFSLPVSVTLERREDVLLEPFAILRWQILKYVYLHLPVAIQPDHHLAGTINEGGLAVE